MLSYEKVETLDCEKEAPAIREQIEGIRKILYEVEMTMEDIISNIIGKPTPERTVQEDTCLQSTFTSAQESALVCMDMAKRIKNLIF